MDEACSSVLKTLRCSRPSCSLACWRLGRSFKFGRCGLTGHLRALNTTARFQTRAAVAGYRQRTHATSESALRRPGAPHETCQWRRNLKLNRERLDSLERPHPAVSSVLPARRAREGASRAGRLSRPPGGGPGGASSTLKLAAGACMRLGHAGNGGSYGPDLTKR
jgi:hypothetical protein